MVCMLLILILNAQMIFSSLLDKITFRKYLKKYDLAECYVSIPRTKRSPHADSENMNDMFYAEVRFKSYDTNFHLLLMEDETFQDLKVESYSSDNTTVRERVTMKMYEGVLKNKSVESYVVGYLKHQVFVGTIKSDETVYFVEPADGFFSNLTFSNKIMVYREEDLDFDINGINGHQNSPHMSPLNRQDFDMSRILPKGINRAGNAKEDYACRMEMVSDHTLYNYFSRNVNLLTAYLYLHGKYADFIFRRTHFFGDGIRERIRIITEKIFIYKSENDPNYPMANTNDMKSFLKLFSSRLQNYCLSLCMSYRYSPGLIIGEAYKANASPKGPPGGICQKPYTASNLFGSVNISVNTAVVTISSAKDVTLPLSISLLAVAHELGHSFGSDHDPLQDLYCAPGGSKGFYLMHPRSQTDNKPLNSLFSPCSRKTMAVVISARGECLKPHSSICGNGVQEGDEECDCGNEKSCSFIDRCCTPSDAKPPEKGCTFRKSKDSTCSPKENKCCLSNCSVNKDTKTQCYNNTVSCLVSYCDGENATCPEPKLAPDKHPCQSTSKTCSGGACNSTVCLDNNLKNCVCKEISFQCMICCKKNNRCVTAYSLGFLTSAGEKYFALEGSPCNSKRYQCDGSGKCANPRQQNSESSGLIISVWWAIGGLTFALLVVLSILGYLVKQHLTKV